jgi:hypothetical protein
MASWSSKSVKRFRVNFQTKKPTIPKTATPPATDMPTIEPTPSLESSGSFGAADGVLEVEDVGDGVLVLVIVTVEAWPSAPVVVSSSTEVCTGGAGAEGELFCGGEVLF